MFLCTRTLQTELGPSKPRDLRPPDASRGFGSDPSRGFESNSSCLGNSLQPFKLLQRCLPSRVSKGAGFFIHPRPSDAEVLGESILNDAVAITLFGSFTDLVKSGEAAWWRKRSAGKGKGGLGVGRLHTLAWFISRVRIYIYTIYSISPFLGTFFTSQIFGRTTELLPFSVGGWSTSLPPLAQVVDGPVALRTRCQRREEATDRAPGGHRDARNGARTDANRTGLRSPNKM